MVSEPSLSLDQQPCWSLVQRAHVGILYKHSPICGASAAARLEVDRFAAGHPTIPICLIDVIREGALAQTVAVALDVPHESPQVIVVSRGVPVWVASHRAIRAEALAEFVRGTTKDARAAGRMDDPTAMA